MDLDLSSLNGILKSGAGASRSSKATVRRKPDTIRPSPDVDRIPTGSIITQESNADPGYAEQESSQNVMHEADAAFTNPSSIQVLDLHTSNPIVSYHDHLYSCTWTDMVGTNMFFVQPGFADEMQPLQSTEDFDLLGMSRIKLAGHRANVKKRPRPKEHIDNPTGDVQAQQKGDNIDPGSRFNSSTDLEPERKRQANFLEQLMAIKQKRGEQDTVRTYVDEKIVSSKKSQFDEPLRAQVDELNRRVVQGDADAVKRLQEIYSGLDDRAMEPT